MASMKDIKLRIKSVESTMQITKAMQLVASSKLRRAREGMEQSRDYLRRSVETLDTVAAGMPAKGVWFAPQSGKRLYIVIAGDRGLAGGFNSNIFKLVSEDAGDAAYCVLAIGKKPFDKFSRQPGMLINTDPILAEGVSVGDTFRLAQLITEKYTAGELNDVRMVYTEFHSMLTQTAVIKHILPLSSREDVDRRHQILMEQEQDELLSAVIPGTLAGSIYSAVKASFASEQAARRTAMDSATKNAGEMIGNLSLKYNRARQGAITQEITEIVAGAEQ